MIALKTVVTYEISLTEEQFELVLSRLVKPGRIKEENDRADELAGMLAKLRSQSLLNHAKNGSRESKFVD